jgi:hypothetical protein
VFPGDGAVDVPMLIGASYMMLRSSYDKFGGFSPFFRTWGRLEQDLSLRRCGRKVRDVCTGRPFLAQEVSLQSVLGRHRVQPVGYRARRIRRVNFKAAMAITSG